MQSPQSDDARVLPLMPIMGDPRPCPYLPGREAREQVIDDGRVSSAMYEQLMERGYRRSGPMYYRPLCDGCSACEPIRVPVAEFTLSRSQHRVLKRNEDVSVRFGLPECDAERYDVYERYQGELHDHCMSGTMEDYEAFFCSSRINTMEMRYSVADRLIGIGIVDLCPDSLSSVYFYYDPDEHRRSIGVYSALMEVELCKRLNLTWWYIGYYVSGCRKMEYKNRFRPYELRGLDGVWRRGD